MHTLNVSRIYTQHKWFLCNFMQFSGDLESHEIARKLYEKLHDIPSGDKIKTYLINHLGIENHISQNFLNLWNDALTILKFGGIVLPYIRTRSRCVYFHESAVNRKIHFEQHHLSSENRMEIGQNTFLWNLNFHEDWLTERTTVWPCFLWNQSFKAACCQGTIKNYAY